MSETLQVPAFEDVVQSLPETSVAWIVYCPEESIQIGDTFFSSEQAFEAATHHNQQTGHNANIAPFFNTGMVEVSNVQNLPWPFCLQYNNLPWQTTIVYAPSPGDAAITAELTVQLLNATAPSLGFPPLFSATGGACSIA